MSTSQNPLNYDPTDPDKMALPVGSTCGDCMHINKCKAMYGHTETDTICDWLPSKFKPAKQPPTDGNWYWVKYEGLRKTYTAPAMYRSDAKAFYSFEFSGVPEKEVVVLRKAQPHPAATKAPTNSPHQRAFLRLQESSCSRT